MREIKFRAWVNIGSYELVANELQGTGSYWKGKDCMCEVQQLNLSTGNMRVKYQKGGTTDVKIHNLMQFTGLLDADGIEIFEGDIISYTQHHFNTEMVKTKVKAVEFIYDRWNVYSTAAGESNVKRIGNIHQNPELLDHAKEKEPNP